MASAANDAGEHLGDKRAVGALTLAAAVKCAPGASPADKALAEAVLRSAANDLCEAPRESESAAQAFARQMDAAIDASDRSRGFDMRSTRRVAVANGLEQARLVLVDVDVLAGLIEAKAMLVEHCQPARLACAAEMEAAGGEHHAAPYEPIVYDRDYPSPAPDPARLDGDYGWGTAVPGDPFTGAQLND